MKRCSLCDRPMEKVLASSVIDSLRLRRVDETKNEEFWLCCFNCGIYTTALGEQWYSLDESDDN